MSDQPKKVSLIEAFASRYEIDPKKVLETLKSVVFKPKRDNNGDLEVIADVQLMSFLLVCQRYDLDPFRKEIIPFSDKKGGFLPVVTIDGWLKVITQHSQCDGFSFEFSKEKINLPDMQREVPESCTCTMYRKDWKYPVQITEYALNCYRPKLRLQNRSTQAWYDVDTPWQTHFERMMRHKVMIQTARYTLGFGDIYDQDEGERIIESQERMSGEKVINDNQPLDITVQKEPAQLEHLESQSFTEFFEEGVQLEPQEELVPTNDSQSIQEHTQNKLAYDLNNVHPQDKQTIDQLVNFAINNNAWEATLDRMESFYGDTKNYALSELNNARQQHVTH